MKTISKSDLGVFGSTSRKYMQPGEQEVLLALVKSVAPKIMVEIGVNEGLTALAVLQHIPGIETYVGIDVDASYRFEIPAQQIERPNQPGVLVTGDPRFQLKMHGAASATMPPVADVVFIDGDHGRKAVLADSLYATALVRPGGIIIWHDYGNPTVEVTGVLNKLQQSRDLVHVTGTWLVFERR